MIKEMDWLILSLHSTLVFGNDTESSLKEEIEGNKEKRVK